MKLLHAMPVLSLLLLTACPYVGTKSNGDACVSVITPVGVMMAYAEQPACSPSRIVNSAPTSTKHVKYSEEQREAMAKEAAYLLYPLHNMSQAELRWGAAQIIVERGTDYIIAAYKCNFKLVVQDLAPKLKSVTLKEESQAKTIAREWLYRYSDDQLEVILKSAKEHGPKTRLESELRPQPPVFGGALTHETSPYFGKPTIDELSKKYASYVKQRYASVLASGRYKENDICHEEKNPTTGEYELVPGFQK
jgi:hypothetical protein